MTPAGEQILATAIEADDPSYWQWVIDETAAG